MHSLEWNKEVLGLTLSPDKRPCTCGHVGGGRRRFQRGRQTIRTLPTDAVPSHQQLHQFLGLLRSVGVARVLHVRGQANGTDLLTAQKVDVSIS